MATNARALGTSDATKFLQKKWERDIHRCDLYLALLLCEGVFLRWKKSLLLQSTLHFESRKYRKLSSPFVHSANTTAGDKASHEST